MIIYRKESWKIHTEVEIRSDFQNVIIVETENDTQKVHNKKTIKMEIGSSFHIISQETFYGFC